MWSKDTYTQSITASSIHWYTCSHYEFGFGENYGIHSLYRAWVNSDPASFVDPGGFAHAHMEKVPFGQHFSALLAAVFVFLVVIAIWPIDSFYVDELQRNSELALIDNYEILAKNASYPDMHGDYSSEAVFIVTKIYLSNLASDMEMLKECSAPAMAKPFLKVEGESVKCREANRNIDEWFRLTYFPDNKILHFRFDQT